MVFVVFWVWGLFCLLFGCGLMGFFFISMLVFWVVVVGVCTEFRDFHYKDELFRVRMKARGLFFYF
jgi:hypothetical protein